MKSLVCQDNEQGTEFTNIELRSQAISASGKREPGQSFRTDVLELCPHAGGILL